MAEIMQMRHTAENGNRNDEKLKSCIPLVVLDRLQDYLVTNGQSGSLKPRDDFGAIHSHNSSNGNGDVIYKAQDIVKKLNGKFF